MKNEISSRERVTMALNRKEPDRVPLALGGTGHKLANQAYFKLRNKLCPDSQYEKVLTGISETCYDEELLGKLGTDFRYVHLANPRPFSHDVYTNEWGVTFESNGYFTAPVGHPLRAKEDYLKYVWPEANLGILNGIRDKAEYLYKHTGYAIVAYRPVPCGLFEQACMLRGTEEFLVDLIADKDFADALLSKILRVHLDLYTLQLKEIGPYVQVVEMLDDYGTQHGPMFSPSFYRELIADKHKTLIGRIRELAPNAKIMFHSCGSVAAFIDQFIEVGFDILNPVQPLADGMNSKVLKDRFGSQISFLGGIDVQEKMLKTENDVKGEVALRVRDLAPGGGYVLAPSHNLFGEVPTENIVTLFECAREYGRYPIRV
ncbi:methylcobalamin:coenzyme M methyltransferase [Peptococcaceae bacterium CEB3]|nr:methylcobalamin:coenzyme M methyltransferase [Peptococcaceae bacterium CEB3]